MFCQYHFPLEWFTMVVSKSEAPDRSPKEESAMTTGTYDYLAHLQGLIAQELTRIEEMKAAEDFIDYDALPTIVIGLAGGDGIGPVIARETRRVLEYLLADAIASGKVRLRDIEGLTLENRVAKMQSVPDDVMAQIKACHVLLKGPTTTPIAGTGAPNLPSANLTIRAALDLFANLRPVKIPSRNVDWAFFRENIEGAYRWGSKGIQVSDDLAVDFVVETRQGSERIAHAAFDYAKKNGKDRVCVVTKANIVKTTDGNFLAACRRVAKDYPGITLDERLIDVCAAKLINDDYVKGLSVFVLPNLYGDIITDVAAELQGGLGTAGSANLGKRYAMFEAIHGSAPDLVESGRTEYANPTSLMRAAAMMLRHIGFGAKAALLDAALDRCSADKKHGFAADGQGNVTAGAFTNFVLYTLSALESRKSDSMAM